MAPFATLNPVSGGRDGRSIQSPFRAIVSECERRSLTSGAKCYDLQQPAGNRDVLEKVEELVLVGEVAWKANAVAIVNSAITAAIRNTTM